MCLEIPLQPPPPPGRPSLGDRLPPPHPGDRCALTWEFARGAGGRTRGGRGSNKISLAPPTQLFHEAKVSGMAVFFCIFQQASNEPVQSQRNSYWVISQGLALSPVPPPPLHFCDTQNLLWKMACTHLLGKCSPSDTVSGVWFMLFKPLVHGCTNILRT